MEEIVVVSEIAESWYGEVQMGAQLVEDLVAELSQLGVGVVPSAGGGGGGGVPRPPVVHQGEDGVQAGARGT